MKILHTADWHIGKMLHKHCLNEELHLFINWLSDLIQRESIDLLLISGDIFDQSNPSAKDREFYYHTLKNLSDLGIRIIITGGNHDSVAVLNAPKQLLELLNITVIGGAMPEIADEIIPVKNKRGEIELVVAAVPFLRDKDLRKDDKTHSYKSRIESLRMGIKLHYDALADICQSSYPDATCIAMGHLYARGVSISESEREIHIGNQAAVESDAFSVHYDYVALGHIHKPQVINKMEHIRYSGSPIALSFSEKKDQKSLVIIELKEKSKLELNIVNIPKFRSLEKLSGTFAQLEEALSEYPKKEGLLPYLELEFHENDFSTLILSEVETLISSFEESTSFKILKHRVIFKNDMNDSSDYFKLGTSISELSPQEVFSKRIESENFTEDEQKDLLMSFQELLESVEQEDK